MITCTITFLTEIHKISLAIRTELFINRTPNWNSIDSFKISRRNDKLLYSTCAFDREFIRIL